MTAQPPDRYSSHEREPQPTAEARSLESHFPETERRSDQLTAMRRMLAASRGAFSLSIAVCNSPALRSYLVDRLVKDESSFFRIAVPNGTEDVLAAVRLGLGSREPSALFVVDLEDSLPSDGPRPAIRSLNATREKWRCFSCPVVFWLPEYAVKLLAVEAKDFWAWRSHEFEFVADLSEPKTSENAASTGGLDAILGLDAERKRFRIDELRERIRNVGEHPDRELTVHVVAWLSELGTLLRVIGEMDEAERMHRQALEIDEELGRLEGMAVDYGNLGLIYRTRGDLDRAEEMHRKALEIDEKLGLLEGMAADYGNLGLIYSTRGDLDLAEEMFCKGLEIDEELGRLDGMAGHYGNLGVVHKARGDLDRAEEMFGKGLEIDEKLGRLDGMATHYGNLGVVYDTRGDHDRAEKMHRKALEVDERLGRLEGMANHYGNLGVIHKTRGDLDRAEEMYRKAVEIDEKLGRLDGIAIGYGNLGNLRWERGDLAGAREYWTKALDLFSRVGMAREIEQTQRLLDELPPE